MLISVLLLGISASVSYPVDSNCLKNCIQATNSCNNALEEDDFICKNIFIFRKKCFHICKQPLNVTGWNFSTRELIGYDYDKNLDRAKNFLKEHVNEDDYDDDEEEEEEEKDDYDDDEEEEEEEKDVENDEEDKDDEHNKVDKGDDKHDEDDKEEHGDDRVVVEVEEGAEEDDEDNEVDKDDRDKIIRDNLDKEDDRSKIVRDNIGKEHDRNKIIRDKEDDRNKIIKGNRDNEDDRKYSEEEENDIEKERFLKLHHAAPVMFLKKIYQLISDKYFVDFISKEIVYKLHPDNKLRKDRLLRRASRHHHGKSFHGRRRMRDLSEYHGPSNKKYSALVGYFNGPTKKLLWTQ